MAHSGGLHLTDFFPGQGIPAALASLLHATEPLSPQAKHFLLCGPERCGKTTLLFHLAYSLAMRGASVLLLGSRTRLEQAPPALAQSVPPSAPAWSKVHIKYIEDEGSLLRYLSLLHLAPSPPDVVLIDDLERFLPAGSSGSGSGGSFGTDGKPKGREPVLCRLLAVACDSLEYVARSTGRPTLLGITVATPGPGEPPRSLHLLQRWLPLLLGCRPTMDQRFMLSALGPPGSNSQLADGPIPVGPAAEYLIDQAGLSVQSVTSRVDGSMMI